MPTGYTAKLHDDIPQSFEEFVLNCARAFAGWTRELSGEDFPDPPKQTYAQNALESYEAKLARLMALPYDEILAEHEVAYWDSRRRDEEQREKTARMRARYQEMLDKVRAWEPPTQEHQGLKDFMIEQLESSIDHDCHDFSYLITAKPFEWHEDRIANARRILERARDEAVKERERNEHNLAWTKSLRDSLAVTT